MRLFVAIEFDEKTKSKMIDVQDQLRAAVLHGNFSRPENLHLTLAFLGEVPEERVGGIIRAMANMMSVPVLGLVENMSYFQCPDCGSRHQIFGESHIDEIAGKFGIEKVAKLPIDGAIAKACDDGTIEDYSSEEMEKLYASL